MTDGPRDIVWALPREAPILDAPTMSCLPRRQLRIAFEWERGADEIGTVEILFTDVGAYRVTFLPAMTVEQMDSAPSAELIRLAEDSLDVAFPSAKCARMQSYRIWFDDGPCFDVLCETVDVRESRRPAPWGSAAAEGNASRGGPS